MEDLIKLFGKSRITNYDALQGMTNHIDIESSPYIVELIFDGNVSDKNSSFTSLWVKEKTQ